MQDPSVATTVPKKPSLWNSCRLTFAICMFFAFFFHVCMRLNLSFTIRCMMKHPENSGSNTTIPKEEMSCSENDERTLFIAMLSEFSWTKAEEGLLISSYFYGYIIGQPVGGLLTEFCKSKLLLITGILVQSICTLMFPPIARLSFPSVVAVRLIQGLCAGLLIPSTYQMYTVWAHPSERATLMSFVYSGFPVGSVLIFPLSSVFCQTEFDNGWPMSFYVIGGTCLVFGISLIWLIYEDTATHPRISPEENEYLKTAGEKKRETRSIPILKMISSVPILTFCTVHFCQSFGVTMLSLSIPQFMEEALYVNIKWNGIYSAAPFLGSLVTRILLSATYYRIFVKTHLSLTVYRKIFHLFGALGSASIIFSISFLNCHHSILIVALFGFLGGLQDLCFIGSYWTSYLELAPAFAGFLSGCTNTLSTLTGIITPNIITTLVQVGTKKEWNKVLYLLTSMYILSALVYTVFGSSKPLPWGQFEETDQISKGKESK